MSDGRFGIHGGQYIPETLMNEIINLEKQYNYYKNDPEFCQELPVLILSPILESISTIRFPALFSPSSGVLIDQSTR